MIEIQQHVMLHASANKQKSWLGHNKIYMRVAKSVRARENNSTFYVKKQKIWQKPENRQI